LFSKGRPKETFSFLFHLTVNDFLGLVRTSLSGE
jgi:hypothetical protein